MIFAVLCVMVMAEGVMVVWLDTFNEMRKKSGMSLDEISKKSGVPKGTLSKITSGVTKAPPLETMRKLVYSMGYTLDDLDAGLEVSEHFSKNEKDLIKKYRVLDEHGKEMVDSALEIEYKRYQTAKAAAEAEQQRQAEAEAKWRAEAEARLKAIQAKTDMEAAEDVEPEEEPKDMIIYTNPAAAGYPVPVEGDFECVPFLESEIPYNADCGVRISGESMEPDIPDGSIVWVSRIPEIENGQVGVFTVDGDPVCKRFYQDSHHNIRLESDNPDFGPVELYEGCDVRLFGRVVGVVPPPED